MSTVIVSPTTYQWLQRKASESARTPDQVADELLREQLAPTHAYVQIVDKLAGPQAMLRGTRVPVSLIIGYLRSGETPDSLVKNILPHLTLAQVYDAQSYYYDHQDEIDRELEENTGAHGQAVLRERLGEEGYRQVTGQAK